MAGRKLFSEDLAFCSGERPVDLLAYKLAQRIFWFRAASDDEECFQSIYDRVLAYLQEEKVSENPKK